MENIRSRFSLHETEVLFTDDYRSQMHDQFGEALTSDLENNWQHADLSHQPDETLLYARVGGDLSSHDRPVLYVPGFTEGIIAKAPFGAAMAKRGFDIIIPGQHRRKIIRDTLNKKNATYAQAANYISVLESEQLTDGPVDIITHSYGSLIFQAMQDIASQRDYRSFEGSRVAMLAPAGSNEREGLLRLGGRFMVSLASEARSKKDFPDPGSEMMKAGTKNFMANIPRTTREVWHLTKRRVDYEKLAVSGIQKAVVLGYAEDKLFPHRVLESTMQHATSAGISYATPISLESYEDGKPRMGRDASHNDEQTNPSRVADAAADFLRTA